MTTTRSIRRIFALAGAAVLTLGLSVTAPAFADRGGADDTATHDRADDKGGGDSGGDDSGDDVGDDKGGLRDNTSSDDNGRSGRSNDKGRDDKGRSGKEAVGTRHLDLPAGFRPEGIAIADESRHGGRDDNGRDDRSRDDRSRDDRRSSGSSKGDVAYIGSLADGDILRLDLRSGASKVISQGPGTPSVGLKVDDRGRLFVSGGSGGDARVIDTKTGALLATYALTTSPAFINDVIVTRDAAWFTDSMTAQLFKLPLGRKGALPTQAQVVTLPLTGAWQQVAGFNANGITTTPDEKALLVVNSTAGLLYRVDPVTGVASVVDLGGYSVTNGDGMLLEGRTLYVVRNQLNTIAAFRVSKDGTAGRLTATITDPDFDVPTTVARSGKRLFLPNARFTTPPTPTTPYWVTGIGVKESSSRGSVKSSSDD